MLRLYKQRPNFQIMPGGIADQAGGLINISCDIGAPWRNADVMSVVLIVQCLLEAIVKKVRKLLFMIVGKSVLVSVFSSQPLATRRALTLSPLHLKTHVVLMHVCPESRTSSYALKCFNFSISSYFAFIKSLSFWFFVILVSFANFVVFGGNGFQWTASKLTLDSDKSLLRTLYQCYKGISEGTTSVRISTFFPPSIFHLFSLFIKIVYLNNICLHIFPTMWTIRQ